MKFLIVAAIAALAVAHDHRSSSSSSGSCSCEEYDHHHHHHHEHPHHEHIDCGHDHHHHHHDIVVNDMTCDRSTTNMVAPKEVKPVEPVVEPVVVVVPNTNPVYTVDPNPTNPYPNGLTVDVFFSCNDNKAFIAKRGRGIYTEIYNLKKAGQTKPKMNK